MSTTVTSSSAIISWNMESQFNIEFFEKLEDFSRLWNVENLQNKLSSMLYIILCLDNENLYYIYTKHYFLVVSSAQNYVWH